MIDEQVKQHDKLSAEIKVSFGARKRVKINDFIFNIWMFVPNSLDINRFNYSKQDFYKDMKSNIRLTTPVYLLRDIVESEISPFKFLRKSFEGISSQPSRINSSEYEYQIKMFLSILKSSLREEVNHIVASSTEDIPYLVNNFIVNIRKIFLKYRELYQIINVPTVDRQNMEYYRYGEEFMCNIMEKHAFMLMKGVKGRKNSSFEEIKEKLLFFAEEITDFKRQKGYLSVENKPVDKNSKFLYRSGLLKKYAESDLFLDIQKRRDGVLVEQIMFSIAAGISMIFATVVAFSVQQRYGNLTVPLFVALVVSYMLKDRIKDLFRFYFAHKMGVRYFDHKITMNVSDTKIGWAKESVDFINEGKVPTDVLRLRELPVLVEATYKKDVEKVLLYKMHVHINRDKLNSISPYYFSGVSAILRLNFSRLLQNMDNPDFPLYLPDKQEGFAMTEGKKYYYISLIIQKQNELQNELIHYKVVLNKEGVVKIEAIPV
jgi:hypothetical protein